MAQRIVELETCTVIFPEGFDANKWSYDLWLEQRKLEISRAGQAVPTPRKEISKKPKKLTQNS